VPRLPALTPLEIIRVLKLRGFVLDRVRGSHHMYYHPESHRHVVVPLHHGDLPKGTFAEILRQAGLSRDELNELL
jgi:predicted RNA binding protein YcfA (HicA-like mRNA interferase family)